MHLCRCVCTGGASWEGLGCVGFSPSHCLASINPQLSFRPLYYSSPNPPGGGRWSLKGWGLGDSNLHLPFLGSSCWGRMLRCPGTPALVGTPGRHRHTVCCCPQEGPLVSVWQPQGVWGDGGWKTLMRPHLTFPRTSFGWERLPESEEAEASVTEGGGGGSWGDQSHALGSWKGQWL